MDWCVLFVSWKYDLNVFGSLELNIHQRILVDIASNDDVHFSEELIAERVSTQVGLNGVEEEERQKIYLVSDLSFLNFHEGMNYTQSANRIHCNIAFGELVVNFPDSHVSNSINTILPVLIDMLRDLPFIEFDRSFSWEGATCF